MTAQRFLSLFLRFKGLIDRREFWIAFAGLAVFVTAYNVLLRRLGPETMTTFWVIITGLPLIFYMIVCVYTKRLKDMGRTRWIFTGAIALQFLVIMALMLSFGGAEYFAEFSQYDRKEDIDPVAQQAIIDAYQAKQAANMHIIKPAMLIIPAALTLWLALSGSKSKHA